MLRWQGPLLLTEHYKKGTTMTFLTPVLPRNRSARQTNIAGHLDRLPTTSTATLNLLNLLDSTTDHEWSSGLVWYSDRARQVALDTISAARTAGHVISFRQAAGIIAALSPSTSWDRNCDGAIELVTTGHCNVQDDKNNAKALAILAGSDPSDVLGGRKVRSFFRNILDPDRSGPVTIDRHAVAILFGRSLSESEQKVLAFSGTYTYCASIYRSVARTYGIAPHELQAIAWQTWRRLKGLSDTEEVF